MIARVKFCNEFVPYSINNISAVYLETACYLTSRGNKWRISWGHDPNLITATADLRQFFTKGVLVGVVAFQHAEQHAILKECGQSAKQKLMHDPKGILVDLQEFPTMVIQ